MAANTRSASLVITGSSLFPNFYFPLYANSPSASLFEPIFVEKLYEGAGNGWGFPETGKGEFGAVDTDKNALTFNMLDYIDENSTDTNSEEDSETLLLESLLSSGSYSTYGNLLGTIKHGSTFTLLPQSEVNSKSSFHNDSNVNAASETYWVTQAIEPEVESKINKVL